MPGASVPSFGVTAKQGTSPMDIFGATTCETLFGTAASDATYGGCNDRLVGLTGDIGNGTLEGGAGEDTIYPGLGDNFAHGGSGVDQLSFHSLVSGRTARRNAVISSNGIAAADPRRPRGSYSSSPSPTRCNARPRMPRPASAWISASSRPWVIQISCACTSSQVASSSGQSA